MKSLILGFSLIFLFVLPTQAQVFKVAKKPEIIVWKVTGKVSFTEAGKTKAMDVKEGMTLPESATLAVGKKSSVTLNSDGKMVTVNKKSSVLVSALMPKATETQSESLKQFFQMASSAKGYIDPSAGNTKLDTTKSRGWGDKDKIQLLLPNGSKIPMKAVAFNWSPLKDVSSYSVIITVSSNKKPIFMATTREPMATVDFGQLAASPGASGKIQISAKDGQITSEEVDFMLVAASDESTALKALLKEKEYQGANGSQKLLMEAVTLETGGMHTAAAERYRSAVNMDKSNSLSKEMQAAFWARQGFDSYAREMMKK